MTNNYAKPLGNDTQGNELQAFPAPYKSNARYTNENAVASSVISLQPTTSEIEVGVVSNAGTGGIVIRWVPLTETASVSPFASVVASGLGANYDHFIPAGWFRQFIVPKETQGRGTGTLQVGSTFGLYQRVAVINAGTTASSVLLSEY